MNKIIDFIISDKFRVLLGWMQAFFICMFFITIFSFNFKFFGILFIIDSIIAFIYGISLRFFGKYETDKSVSIFFVIPIINVLCLCALFGINLDEYFKNGE